MLKQRVETAGVHLILIAYCLLAIGPILLVVMNSFKARKAIFGAPLAPPNADTFSLIGYNKVFSASHVGTYFMNSLIVTLVSMFLPPMRRGCWRAPRRKAWPQRCRDGWCSAPTRPWRWVKRA